MKDELTEDDVVVLLFSDHGSKYLNKIFNEQWLEENVFKTEKEDAKVQQMNNQRVRKIA
jgi:cystathionine beta-synthase